MFKDEEGYSLTYTPLIALATADALAVYLAPIIRGEAW